MATCIHCTTQARYIAALEKYARHLEITLINSQRSLAAKGKATKNARREVEEAKKMMENQP